ncbi:hypothetical protein GCM10010528_26480 [Gordonia defluvii]|uniref:Uncharacterized protein n=1 Tax=Gordonia defluvii TaxID=283718 RepID=A0ABP6LN05_9ACTN
MSDAGGIDRGRAAGRVELAPPPDVSQAASAAPLAIAPAPIPAAARNFRRDTVHREFEAASPSWCPPAGDAGEESLISLPFTITDVSAGDAVL